MAPIPPYPSEVVERAPDALVCSRCGRQVDELTSQGICFPCFTGDRLKDFFYGDKPKPEPYQPVEPFQRPPEPVRPKPFITRVPEKPVERVAPEQPNVQVLSHPATVELPPPQEAQQYTKPVATHQENIPNSIPEQEQKEFPKQFGNNSETIRKGNSLEPTQAAPIAVGEGYKKKGRVGRQRRYEEPGKNGEIPVKKVVLFRHVKGRHWPGMSQDMQEWYDRYYFTKPKKTGKAADHARHLKSYERGQRWIAEHEGRDYQPGAVGHSGKVLAYRKRATS